MISNMVTADGVKSLAIIKLLFREKSMRKLRAGSMINLWEIKYGCPRSVRKLRESREKPVRKL